jgi:hypothetical protein
MTPCSRLRTPSRSIYYKRLLTAGYAHQAGQYNKEGLLEAGYAHLADQFDKEGLLATGYSHIL